MICSGTYHLSLTFWRTVTFISDATTNIESIFWLINLRIDTYIHVGFQWQPDGPIGSKFFINKNLDFTRFCGMTDPGTVGSCGGESKKNKKLLRVYSVPQFPYKCDPGRSRFMIFLYI